MDELKTKKEHRGDLKKGFLSIIIIFVIFIFLFFYLSPIILDYLLSYLEIPPENIVALTPFENIQTRFSIAFGLSLALLLPAIILSIYNFCKPALPENVQNKSFNFLFKSISLAILGILFGVFVFSKFTLNTLMNSYSLANPMWSVSSLIEFITTSSVSFALIFQIVWIIPSLSSFGVIKIKKLKEYRLVVLLIIFIISAIITPPDFTSQIIMTIPFYTCYELGILLSKSHYTKNEN